MRQKLIASVANFLATLGVVLGWAASAQAATVTWTGAGPNDNWDTASNWSSDPALPGTNDDVIHNNGDTIQMNVGSQSSPTTIKSFTATGSAGGGLVIQANRGIIVTGNFTNSSTGAGDRYELTMEEHSRLDVGDSETESNLVRVNVTMEAVPTGDPSTLAIGGAILCGRFEVNDRCEVEVGLADEAADAELSDDLFLVNEAHVTFMKTMKIITGSIITVSLDGGSTLTFLEGQHETESTIYVGHPDTTPVRLEYGQGTNVVEMGSPDATDPSLDFSCGARIAAINPSNAGELVLSLHSQLLVTSSFGEASVRDEWDTRNVDAVIQPVPGALLNGDRHEVLISPELKDYFPDVPVIFIDVPCLGTWRDLIVPEAGEIETDPFILKR